MTKSKSTTEWRVEQLERNYRDLDQKLDRILTNHLPHLEEALHSLKTRVDVFTLLNVGAIIIGVLISKYL
jgi:hypothetical protein